MLRAALALGCASLTLTAPLSAYATAMPATRPARRHRRRLRRDRAAAPAAKQPARRALKPRRVSAARPAHEQRAPAGRSLRRSAPPAPVPPAPAAAPRQPPRRLSTQPPPAPVTAKTPAATSAPAAAAKRLPSRRPTHAPRHRLQYPNTQLRYGSYLVFRNLIPSPMLEAQAAEEFQQITYGAQHANQPVRRHRRPRHTRSFDRRQADSLLAEVERAGQELEVGCGGGALARYPHVLPAGRQDRRV